MSSELFGTFDYCVGPSELGMDVLSAYQVVGHTILVIYTVYTLQKEPNSADDIFLFLLDILTLYPGVRNSATSVHYRLE